MQRGAFALSSSEEDNDDDEEEEEEEKEASSTPPVSPPGGPPPLEGADLLRFRAELEFVQLLASPTYLHYLATYEYLEDDEFLRYLKYLKYWREPRYLAFIEYPECLHFLDRLNDDADFRKELKVPQCRDKLHHEQFYRWRNRYFDMHKKPSFLPDRDDDFGAATYGLSDKDINVVHDEHPLDFRFNLQKPSKADLREMNEVNGNPSGAELGDKWFLPKNQTTS